MGTIFTSTWQNWANKSNISGIRNASKSDSMCRKICWWIIFVLFFVLTIMGLVPYIHYYLSYPISTTITFQKHPVSEFPAVTVCGQSRINCENAQNAAGNCQNGDSDECKLTSAQSIEVVQVILEHFCPSSNNSRKKREENHDEEKIPTSEDLGEISPEVGAEYEFLTLYTILSEADRTLIGHDFSGLFRSCAFRERNCLNKSSFSPINTPNFGNCFTFNSEHNDLDPFGGNRVSSVAGPNFGLDLQLDGGQEGVRLVIHHPSKWPLPDQNGINLGKNSLTSISIQNIEVSRLQAPYASNCTKEWSNTQHAHFIPESGFADYTQNLCSRICMQFMTQEKCGCFHPLFLDSDELRNDLEPCVLTSGHENSACVSNILDTLDRKEGQCDCDVECRETKFAPEIISQTTFNEGDLLRVQIYYSSLVKEHVKEYAVLDINTLIGGMMVILFMYLGLSISKILELLELFLDLIVNYSLFLCCNKKTPGSITPVRLGP